MSNFIELHYATSGDAVLFNIAAISRVYTTRDTKEVRIALLEDKNKTDTPTECSRQACYKVRESYETVLELIEEATGKWVASVQEGA